MKDFKKMYLENILKSGCLLMNISDYTMYTTIFETRLNVHGSMKYITKRKPVCRPGEYLIFLHEIDAYKSSVFCNNEIFEVITAVIRNKLQFKKINDIKDNNGN